MLVDQTELKKQLRQRFLQERTALGEAFQKSASQSICTHISAWTVFQQSSNILAYLPMRGEVDLTPLLQGFPGKAWYLPRTLPGGEMLFHRFDPQHLVRHRYGMLEPEASLPVIKPQWVELVLTPGLSYDRQGYRLGYGGGFYDRFLSGVPTGIFLGVTFQALVQDSLPHGDHDVRVQYLVTETGITPLPEKTG